MAPPSLVRNVICNGLAIRRLIGHLENKMLCNLSCLDRNEVQAAVLLIVHCTAALN